MVIIDQFTWHLGREEGACAPYGPGSQSLIKSDKYETRSGRTGFFGSYGKKTKGPQEGGPLVLVEASAV